MLPRSCDTFVYTMGKVASTSIATSLFQSGIDCFDIHALAPDQIQTRIGAHMASPDHGQVPRHLIESLVAHNAMQQQEHVRIVTVIRDPVARNISAVFQGLRQKHAANLRDIALDRIKLYRTDIPDKWFIDDFGPATGIDVFNQSVDPSADHFHFIGDKCSVLMLKIEVDDKRKQDLLSAFLEKPVVLVRANDASDKWYRDVYNDIRKSLNTLTQDFIRSSLESRYFMKFYPLEERRALWRKYLT